MLHQINVMRIMNGFGAIAKMINLVVKIHIVHLSSCEILFFFFTDLISNTQPDLSVASARAGNVIEGDEWSQHGLVRP